MYQAAFITVEDTLVSFGTWIGVKGNRWIKTLGFVWTFAWLMYSTPFLNDWHLVAGMGQHRLFPSLEVVAPVSAWAGETLGVDIARWVRETLST